MVDLARYLDQAIRTAGVPITGVSIGDPNDRRTWRVHPASAQAQAQPIIDAFQLPTLAQMKDESAIREIDAKALKAVVMELYPYLSAGKPSLAQLRQNILDRYKQLNGS